MIPYVWDVILKIIHIFGWLIDQIYFDQLIAFCESDFLLYDFSRTYLYAPLGFTFN